MSDTAAAPAAAPVEEPKKVETSNDGEEILNLNGAIVATTATTAPEVEEDAVAVAVVDPAAAVASRAGSE
jgi:hypothetical protein